MKTTNRQAFLGYPHDYETPPLWKPAWDKLTERSALDPLDPVGSVPSTLISRIRVTLSKPMGWYKTTWKNHGFHNHNPDLMLKHGPTERSGWIHWILQVQSTHGLRPVETWKSHGFHRHHRHNPDLMFFLPWAYRGNFMKFLRFPYHRQIARRIEKLCGFRRLFARVGYVWGIKLGWLRTFPQHSDVIGY